MDQLWWILHSLHRRDSSYRNQCPVVPELPGLLGLPLEASLKPNPMAATPLSSSSHHHWCPQLRYPLKSKEIRSGELFRRKRPQNWT